MPWLERDEDVFNWDLFQEDEREKLFVKYNIAALMRGDPKTQAEILEIKRRNGIVNADEWRALDDENPLPDGLGQEYVLPLNYMFMSQMAELGNQNQENEDEGTEETEGAEEEEEQKQEHPQDRLKRARQQRSVTARRRIREAHMSAFMDGVRRYVKRDVDAVIKALKKAFEIGKDPAESLKRWIEDFYPGQEQYIARVMRPLVDALAGVIASEAVDEIGADPVDIETFVQEYVENLAQREAGSSRGQLLAIVDDVPAEELEAAVTTRANEWKEKRPPKVAANEVVRVAAGAARFAWRESGVRYLVWRATPGACELCQQLDGNRVGIAEYFLATGESVGDLSASGNIGGPPLHQGCQCDIVPE